MTQQINVFMENLASKAPTPGGGGASALVGSISSSLCSMVANLTSGKKKYAEYQSEIEEVLIKTKCISDNMLELIQKDAIVFEPLSQAYGIPKDSENREQVLEEALKTACTVPFEILCEAEKLIDILEMLTVKGSKLALSDVGVAATNCRGCMEGAALNVYINTKLMKNREYAEDINNKTNEILSKSIIRCNKVYINVLKELGGNI